MTYAAIAADPTGGTAAPTSVSEAAEAEKYGGDHQPVLGFGSAFLYKTPGQKPEYAPEYAGVRVPVR